MSEMIERVARAIFRADYPEEGEGSEIAWEKRAHWYSEAARAAIEAMREPTEEMSEAGNVPTYQWVDNTADDVWSRMIDAALK